MDHNGSLRRVDSQLAGTQAPEPLAWLEGFWHTLTAPINLGEPWRQTLQAVIGDQASQALSDSGDTLSQDMSLAMLAAAGARGSIILALRDKKFVSPVTSQLFIDLAGEHNGKLYKAYPE